ncbi:putative phosphatase [Burkholderiales bacterium]|nr:MAG: HAD family hydrolase [Burkholderiales bacterium]CAG0990686.1 putative phosphatase [Burkholderiales bacterium]
MILSLFDLDNTLLDGDSDYAWAQYLIEVGVLDAASYEAQNERFYQDYQLGRLDIRAFLDFQLAPLARFPTAQLHAWRDDFLERKIRPLVLPAALALVRERVARGDRVAIVTATNAFITRPIADLFGVEHLLATEPEQINGRYTGKVVGEPCFQAGKVLRLESWLEGQGTRLAQYSSSWFFSDSRNDLPLLRVVTRPVAVRPDPALRELAESLGWPILSLRGDDPPLPA